MHAVQRRISHMRVHVIQAMMYTSNAAAAQQAATHDHKEATHTVVVNALPLTLPLLCLHHVYTVLLLYCSVILYSLYTVLYTYYIYCTVYIALMYTICRNIALYILCYAYCTACIL
jgi:hypothetical protein